MVLRDPVSGVWSSPTRTLSSADNITHDGNAIPRGDFCQVAFLKTATSDIYGVMFSEDSFLKDDVSQAWITVTLANGTVLISSASLTQMTTPNYFTRTENLNRVAIDTVIHVAVTANWNAGDPTVPVYANTIPVVQPAAVP